MKILASSLANYLNKYAEKYGTDDIIVFFTDGTSSHWKSQHDYIMGRIHGIRDVTTSSELNGKVWANIYIYSNRTVMVHITFEWGE